VDGFPYESRCPAGLYFDDIGKLCTFKADARCGPIATSEFLTHNPVFKIFDVFGIH
jgi:hypothetical protein